MTDPEWMPFQTTMMTSCRQPTFGLYPRDLKAQKPLGFFKRIILDILTLSWTPLYVQEQPRHNHISQFLEQDINTWMHSEVKQESSLAKYQ